MALSSQLPRNLNVHLDLTLMATQNTASNITIIGSRGSGKTTYLAALAYWPQKLTEDGKTSRFRIKSSGDQESDKLVMIAETIILERKSMQPSKIIENLTNINQIPRISLTLSIEHRFKRYEEIYLVTRDYPGEILHHIQDPDPVQKIYLEECFDKKFDGCLLMLDRWEPGSDRYYSSLIRKFMDLMCNEYERADDYKVAVVLSKCERGELWPSRLDPEIDLFNSHLKETTKILKSYLSPQNLQFFALSTFGVLDDDNFDFRPNRKLEIIKGREPPDISSLRKLDNWKPYGMIAPLYWIAKNKRIKND